MDRLRQLDRETLDNYQLTVKATNTEGSFSKLQIINITVTDLNDNHPIFTQPTYNTSILEDASIGTTVIQISATDRDIGKNAEIQYYIIPGSARDVFHINATTGYITLEQSLDREARDLYVLYIRAFDNMFPVFAELSIFVLDINEHQPIFYPKVYNISVPETILPGTSIIQVRATDQDTGPNAELSYEIIAGDPSELFRITKSGMIQNYKSLDYEVNTTFYLIISVRDNGVAPLSASNNATVNISVVDSNDNSPHFDKPEYRASVFENETAGIELLTVRATDQDGFGKGRFRL